MNLRILHEDEHVIVCYKPAGIATQTAKMGSQDMESLLKNYLYKKEKKMPYVAVIHRLDQPVEGILVFAKTPFAAKELNKGLQGAGFGKYYKAVVCGTPKEKKAMLEDYLVKDGKTNTSRVGKKDEAEAKKAVLTYEVIQQTDVKALLKINRFVYRWRIWDAQSGEIRSITQGKMWISLGKISHYVHIISNLYIQRQRRK